MVLYHNGMVWYGMVRCLLVFFFDIVVCCCCFFFWVVLHHGSRYPKNRLVFVRVVSWEMRGSRVRSHPPLDRWKANN